MADRILVIDDDESIRELLELYLESAGFVARSCGDARNAQVLLDSDSFDLVLLDVMLPDIQGIEVCRSIKQKSGLPVIMITARDMLKDKIAGFNAGADDYIVKPFEPAEVIARVNARLRNTVKSSQHNLLAIGDVTVNLATYEVLKNSNKIELKPKEIQLFHFLLLNKNIVFSRDTLLQRVWNYEFSGDTRTVDVHIKTLRQKLLDENSAWDIKTIRGVGYKLEGK